MIKKVSLIIGILVVIAIGVSLYHRTQKEYQEEVKLYRDNAIKQIYPCLYEAIDAEFFDRVYKSGVPYEEWKFAVGADCEGYEIKTVEVPDTSFQVRIKCGDLRGHLEIKQFIFKEIMPLNLHNLDSIFRKRLSEKGVRVKNVYIEYTDVREKETVSIGNKPTENSYITEFETIDILKSIGVKVWVDVAVPTFWEALFI